MEEIEDVLRRASRAAEPGRVRVVPVGTCVRSGCDGKLRAVIKLDSASGARHSDIRCSADPEHAWLADEWARLASEAAHTPRQPRRLWYTVAEVEALAKIKSGSVYRLASQFNWRRRKVAGKVYYCARDVDAHVKTDRPAA
ncbi:hypothetical protein ACIGW3_22755 [Streptomyces sp. NPDC053499]|uniref:hypothetical protein n=1 Tax=Streptomyces sp. NPDC053499 TaxID=3365707 RepID=UPI0037D787C4